MTRKKPSGSGNPGGRLPPLVRDHPLCDAQLPIELTITATDVAKAVSGDPTKCAAARALRRQLGVCQAAVMRHTTYVNYGTAKEPKWSRYATGHALGREIVAIDRGGRFEPGEFHIRPHSPASRLGTRPYTRRTKPTGHKTPRAYHVTANIRESH